MIMSLWREGTFPADPHEENGNGDAEEPLPSETQSDNGGEHAPYYPPEFDPEVERNAYCNRQGPVMYDDAYDTLRIWFADPSDCVDYNEPVAGVVGLYDRQARLVMIRVDRVQRRMPEFDDTAGHGRLTELPASWLADVLRLAARSYQPREEFDVFSEEYRTIDAGVCPLDDKNS